MTLWRRGVAAVVYAAFPHTVAYPTARPTLLLLRAGFETHILTRKARGQRTIDGATAWEGRTRVDLAKRLLELRPEFMFMEWPSGRDLFLLPLARRTWVRSPPDSESPLANRLRRGLLHLSDRVSFLSPHAASRFQGLPERKIGELPHPIDISFWSTPVERDPEFWAKYGARIPPGPVLTYVANFVQLKQHEELVRTLAPLLHARRDTSLVFAGWFGTDNAVVDRVRLARTQEGLQDQVILLGPLPREDVRQLLAWTNVVPFFSATEAQSMATFEALAAAVPVLLPDIPELRSLFPHLPVHRTPGDLIRLVESCLDGTIDGAALVQSAKSRLGWADVREHDRLFLAGLQSLGVRTPSVLKGQ